MSSEPNPFADLARPIVNRPGDRRVTKAAPIKPARKPPAFAPEVIAAHQKRCADNRAKNPWGLTPAEMVALDAIYRTGGSELAARDLGLSIKTINGRVTEILKKMDAANRTLAVLAYARWIWAAQGTTT